MYNKIEKRKRMRLAYLTFFWKGNIEDKENVKRTIAFIKKKKFPVWYGLWIIIQKTGYDQTCFIEQIKEISINPTEDLRKARDNQKIDITIELIIVKLQIQVRRRELKIKKLFRNKGNIKTLLKELRNHYILKKIIRNYNC